MSKTQTSKPVRLGRVSRETRAGDPTGVPELHNPVELSRIG